MTTWALDLDGVLWTGKTPIPGSSAAVGRLLDAGHDVVFVTNNSFSTIAQQEAQLARLGIEAAGRVLNSARAAASLVQAGQRTFVLGGEGIREAVVAVQGELVTDLGSDPGDVDVVLVGLYWDLT